MYYGNGYKPGVGQGNIYKNVKGKEAEYRSYALLILQSSN
jgi:hypothetical protein